MQKVLIIDDNPDVSKALSLMLELQHIDAVSAIDPEAGLAIARNGGIDLVIQDMNFSEDTTSGQEGVVLFHNLRTIDADLPIILLTAWANLETAVELVKAGAADYVSKPWNDDKLVTTIKNLLELRELQYRQRNQRRERQQRFSKLAEAHNLCSAIFASEAMYQVLSLAVRFAKADLPVLITGPNGVGKDVIAHIIQANSTVAEGPFVTVNVGALPNDLMEAELFGVETGAYTGANTSRKGRFEAAHGGTLFLDEIGNLPQQGQMKLLRVLQTGEFERLGSAATQHVQVRIISATNTDLHAAISAGRFREDLFYRLNALELQVPALAERREDILPLARHFLGPDQPIDYGAEHVLLDHDWPGNVRELKNVMQRAALLTQGKRIQATDLGLPVRDARWLNTENDDEITRKQLVRELGRSDGNVSQAARALGISRQAVYRRLDKYNIDH